MYGFIVPTHLAKGRDNEFYKIYLLKHYIQFQLVFSGTVVIKWWKYLITQNRMFISILFHFILRQTFRSICIVPCTIVCASTKEHSKPPINKVHSFKTSTFIHAYHSMLYDKKTAKLTFCLHHSIKLLNHFILFSLSSWVFSNELRTWIHCPLFCYLIQFSRSMRRLVGRSFRLSKCVLIRIGSINAHTDIDIWMFRDFIVSVSAHVYVVTNCLLLCADKFRHFLLILLLGFCFNMWTCFILCSSDDLLHSSSLSLSPSLSFLIRLSSNPFV